MALNKLRALKIRLQTMKDSLRSQTESKNNGHISFAIADRFNEALKAIQEECPEVSEYLPSPITKDGPFTMMKVADVTYLDLEIFIDEIIALLSEHESGE